MVNIIHKYKEIKFIYRLKMENNKSNFTNINYQKEQKIFDLKVNINKKRENSINQLLSLIPGNEFINKKRKKNKNTFNYKINEKQSEEKEQYKKILEKRKNLLQKTFTFKETNSNNINKNKELNKDKLLFKNDDNKNNEIQYTLINTNNNRYVPDYEPWDKELIELILPKQNEINNIITNYSSITEEELQNIISSKLSNNDSHLIELISYTQHPTPQINSAKDKEDSTNLQFVLTKKEKRSLKKIYKEQKRKDEQEKIKLGLMKPKERKLKYSNMIQLFNGAIENPSQIYQKVENSYKEREKRMIEENEKNKLTKEQRRIKFREKIDKDQEKGLYGYFFKIQKIYDIENYNRFNSWMKIFCKKYKISGFLIHFYKKQENFAYLEGGQKALNKIQKRIENKLKIEQNNILKKSEDIKNKEKNEINKNNNDNNNNIKEKYNDDTINKSYSCVLKWKGIIKKKNFYQFQILIKQNHQELLQFLEESNLIHLNNNIN